MHTCELEFIKLAHNEFERKTFAQVKERANQCMTQLLHLKSKKLFCKKKLIWRLYEGYNKGRSWIE